MEHFYKKVQGWFRFRDFYRKAVQEAPKRGARFVEVGSWKGKSSTFMAVEILNSGKQIHFDCVDTWEGSDEPAHHSDPDVQKGFLYERFLLNTDKVSHIINPMRMLSVEAAAAYEDESLDFVCIDASHDYENVIEDLKAWWPKIKPGCVMSGDDYRWSGVNKAVLEFFGVTSAPQIEGIEFDYVNNKEGDPVCWSVRKPKVV